MSFDVKRLIKFEHNVGAQEKKYRLWGGAAAIFISLFIASVPLLLIGCVLVATGYSGWCPAYSALDKSTLEQDTTSSDAEDKEDKSDN
ncbi:YgaP family membrane protein [methane-oxidizing endosymbiont of Gigantopelta aegis]|uniref:YgaP family membrane protein n=1 Tax=methane-oxidizing endosymbiont of Gigantopelta aegis TaxID=2794938 RepID=UPI0018DD5D11|nr:DUF2892 domain-containing protein [methane-oxidizing endosymbiont of Gigantopelta aegis]